MSSSLFRGKYFIVGSVPANALQDNFGQEMTPFERVAWRLCMGIRGWSGGNTKNIFCSKRSQLGQI